MSVHPGPFVADPAADPSLLAAYGDRLRDPMWRICEGAIYKIMTKEQGVIPFVANPLQREFLEELWHRNLIVKGRQIGFTTLISIVWLDHGMFVPDQRCAQVAQDLDKAKEIFRDKVAFAYDNLPPLLKRVFPTRKRNESELHFAHNNSLCYVDASVRGGTVHRLHISEFGKISVNTPLKAREVVTGGFPAVPASGVAIIESTAEGSEGEFYDMAQVAEQRAELGGDLIPKEWKFFFFAWWQHDEYEIDPAGVVISAQDHEYFDQKEAEIIGAKRRPMGWKLNLRKRAWYVITRANDLNGDQAKMWQEFPSTPAEAWQKSPEGVYYAKQLAAARVTGRIRRLPIVSYLPINTFWDIGSKDGTGIWLHQNLHPWHNIVRYVQGWGESFGHFTARLDEMAAQHGEGWAWGKHYLPHDAQHKRQMQHRVCSPLDMLQELKPQWKFEIVPPIDELQHGIEMTRRIFPQFVFDAEGCAEGLKHLGNYRKRRNATTGGWMDEPLKNDATEAADSLRQLAQAFDMVRNSGNGSQRPKRKGREHLS